MMQYHTFFLICPHISQRKLQPEGVGAATAESRSEKEERKLFEQEKLKDKLDKVVSIDDLLSKLNRSLLPDDMLENRIGNSILFFFLCFDTKPTLSFCLRLEPDLSFTAWQKEVKVPVSKLRHITRLPYISCCSKLIEIILFLTSSDKNDDNDDNDNVMDTILHCVDKLNNVISCMDEETQAKACFLTEQLLLLSKHTKGRRYSADLIATSTMWLLNSPSLYNQIRKEVLTLPVPNYIKRLTSAITVDLGLSKATETYLKTRFDHLPHERDKIVSVVMDEVYVAGKVEYTGGKCFGCENGIPTKTLLGTMLKSVAGRYQDIVSLTPLTRIDAKIITKVFTTLLETAVKIGFDITVSILDGHSSNCKFYKELCSGMMNLCIVNPLKAADRIFLLFDPVHLFKNFYNNLINKLYFECLNFEDKVLKPNMQHIKNICNAELGKSVKIAYRLSDKVLNPATIERSNVSLADSLFHESPIAALNFYAG